MLVVGQVPPPVNGQSLMIQEFLEGSYEGMRLEHVPLRFSRSTAEIGGFDLRKLWVLAQTIVDIVRARFRTGATVLYYPPAGPNLVPVLRDLVLLNATRWLFRKTAFHFHAAGLAAIYPRLPLPLKPLFWSAYNKPDLAIFTTAATSAEATILHAARALHRAVRHSRRGRAAWPVQLRELRQDSHHSLRRHPVRGQGPDDPAASL